MWQFQHSSAHNNRANVGLLVCCYVCVCVFINHNSITFATIYKRVCVHMHAALSFVRPLSTTVYQFVRHTDARTTRTYCTVATISQTDVYFTCYYLGNSTRSLWTAENKLSGKKTTEVIKHITKRARAWGTTKWTRRLNAFEGTRISNINRHSGKLKKEQTITQHSERNLSFGTFSKTLEWQRKCDRETVTVITAEKRECHIPNKNRIRKVAAGCGCVREWESESDDLTYLS